MGRDPADSIHRQGCRHPCGDGATQIVLKTGKVLQDERMHVQIADVPVAHVALNERISERMHEQNSAACGGATTGSSASNCGKDGVFPSIKQVTQHALFPQVQNIDKVVVDMPAVMQRMVPRIQTSWKTVGVPPAWVRRQSCGGACDHTDAPVVPAPVPQILEAEEAQLFPHERMSELTIEVWGPVLCPPPSWMSSHR